MASSAVLSEDDTCSETSDHVEFDADSYDSDEDVYSEEPVSSYKSKDKEIEWFSNPFPQSGRASSSNVMHLTPGITRYAITRISDEKSAFDLLITKGIQQIVIDNTNLEGVRVYGSDWKALDYIELEAYIGLLILAGVYKSNNEALDNLWHEHKGRHIFRSTMSLKRFKTISRVIRFDDRSTRAARRSTDKMAPIRELWDKWVEILPNLLNPGEHVTVDEQLVGFRGRCPFRQYMPNKPAKYGIKFWVLCDSKNTYVWNIQIYTGKEPGAAPERNQGLRVVLDLCSTQLKGRNVTIDNFFTSYKLGQMLLKRNITMIGTIRKNKTSIPPVLLDVKGKPVFSSMFAFTRDTTMVSYVPRKNKCVILQSTLHNRKEVANDAEKKPSIILDYNATKGGVDTVDKKVACYTSKRKTNRWPVVVFGNILDVSVVNAFVLFTSVNHDWNTQKHHRRRLFIETLGESLIKGQMTRRVYLPRSIGCRNLIADLTESNTQQSLPGTSASASAERKRGRCSFCKKSTNKHTSKCKICTKFICKAHTNNICLKCIKN